MLIKATWIVTVLFRKALKPISKAPTSMLCAMFEGRQVTLLRRMVGVSLDWLACYLIVYGFRIKGETSVLVLLLFFFEMAALIAFGGASFGHRMVAIKVVKFSDGSAPTPLQALIRTALLCTVVFAITFDENGRGIHERLSGTYLVRS